MNNAANTKIYQTPIAQVTKSNQIIHVKLNAGLTELLFPKNILLHFDILEEITEGIKHAFIINVDNVQPIIVPKKTRELINKLYYKYATCNAFVSKDSRLNFMINLYFKLAPTRVPMKIFKSREDANEWTIGEHMKNQFQISF